MLKSIAVTARRDDVREAALALFAERGYHGTSMKDSAARLGIRAPSLYNHVESKQQILLYVVQTPGERVEMLIDRNDLLKHYFDGQWVTLTVREAPGEPWQRRTPDGEWEPWHPATTPTPKEIVA
jgi:AcrR family transcriptional regulator